jgi:hypothetical protein
LWSSNLGQADTVSLHIGYLTADLCGGFWIVQIKVVSRFATMKISVLDKFCKNLAWALWSSVVVWTRSLQMLECVQGLICLSIQYAKDLLIYLLVILHLYVQSKD